MAAVTSIMRVEQIIMGRLNALLEPADLTFPRYEALVLLSYSREGQLPLGKLSERLQVHRASVTNVITRLERSGYVARVAHERDRRAVLARITPEGRRAATAATRRLNAEGFGMGPLADADCERLFELLRPLRVDAGDFSAD